MLDTIPDDYFTHLCNIDYSYHKDLAPLFLTCQKLYLLNNININEILKRKYQLLIRNNHIENPKKTYYNIYKIYKDRFVMCKEKLSDLAVTSIQTNNVELLYLLYKVMPSFMRSEDIKIRMLRNALNVKSLNITNYLLSQLPVLKTEELNDIVRHYYNNKINSSDIIVSLLSHSTITSKDIYHNIFITQSLSNDDLDTFKLVANAENANQSLAYAIHQSNIYAVKYITATFEYDKKIITNYITDSIAFSCINNNLMMDLLLQIHYLHY